MFAGRQILFECLAWLLAFAPGQHALAHAWEIDKSTFAGQWTTPHFCILFLEEERGWAEDLRDNVEILGQKALSDLGIPFPKETTVVVARDLNDLRRFSPPDSSVPSWAIGVAFSEEHLILLRTSTGTQPVENLQQIFLHEWAHIAFDQAVPFRSAPRWFREGFAIYESGEWSIHRFQTLASGVLSGKLMTLDELGGNFPSKGGDVELAYAQSIDFLSYLLGSYGQPAFHRLIGLLHDGWSFDAALEESYDTSLGLIEEGWHRDLQSRFTWISVLSGTALVWFLVTIVFLWATIKKRRRRLADLSRMTDEDGLPDGFEPPKSEDA